MIFESGSQQEAADVGVVDCVIRALDLFQHSAETQRISLVALNILTILQTNCLVVGSAGGVWLAIRALRTFPENTRVITHAFRLLGDLACLPQFREEALGMNALVLCVAALRRCGRIDRPRGLRGRRGGRRRRSGGASSASRVLNRSMLTHAPSGAQRMRTCSSGRSSALRNCVGPMLLSPTPFPWAPWS